MKTKFMFELFIILALLLILTHIVKMGLIINENKFIIM